MDHLPGMAAAAGPVRAVQKPALIQEAHLPRVQPVEVGDDVVDGVAVVLGHRATG